MKNNKNTFKIISKNAEAATIKVDKGLILNVPWEQFNLQLVEDQKHYCTFNEEWTERYNLAHKALYMIRQIFKALDTHDYSVIDIAGHMSDLRKLNDDIFDQIYNYNGRIMLVFLSNNDNELLSRSIQYCAPRRIRVRRPAATRPTITPTTTLGETLSASEIKDAIKASYISSDDDIKVLNELKKQLNRK